MQTGVISTTRNVNCEKVSEHYDANVGELAIQFEADAKAAAGARIGNGLYSAGSSQGMANRPTLKKKLKRKSMTLATMPGAKLETEVVPARMAMQQHCPTSAKIINLRCNDVLAASTTESLAAHPSDPINQPNRHQRREKVGRSVRSSEKERDRVREANGPLEDDGCVCSTRMVSLPRRAGGIDAQ